MRILSDPSQLNDVEDVYIRDLISRRFEEIANEGYDFDEVGMFVVAEPGDQIDDLERVTGVRITSGPPTEAKYGDQGFMPFHELLEWHEGHCFEMVHILSDTGYGVTTIVPDRIDLDPLLLQFCKDYAVPAEPVIGTKASDAYVPGV